MEATVALPGAPRQRQGNLSYDVPVGFIVHNVAANSLDAHCSHLGHVDPSNPCRLNRTVFPGPRGRGGQGRPVGLYMAWLAAAAKYDSRVAHKAAARDVPIAERQPAAKLVWLCLVRGWGP